MMAVMMMMLMMMKMMMKTRRVCVFVCKMNKKREPAPSARGNDFMAGGAESEGDLCETQTCVQNNTIKRIVHCVTD